MEVHGFIPGLLAMLLFLGVFLLVVVGATTILSNLSWYYTFRERPAHRIIYKIVNKTDGKLYVGITVNYDRRKEEHFTWYRSERHWNKPLYVAMRREGPDNFYMTGIQAHQGLWKEAHEVEVEWILELDSLKPNGYNATLEY